MPITVTPEEARSIVKDAYLYGWPLSENYNTIYAYNVDTTGPNYKAPINQIYNENQVYTPEDTSVVTPNSDTPYSFVTADLRAEPLVLTVPAMSPTNRYFSYQLIDCYTYNFNYIGTRATGNAGGTFLLVGPSWQGGDTSQFTGVFYSESELDFVIVRTQLFAPDDMPNVEAIQAQYKVQTLSQFTGSPPPPAAPQINWPLPATGDAGKTPAVFSVVNFILQFCPTHPTEVGLMERFAKIGVGAGLPFDAESLSPEMLAAFEAGIADAWAEFEKINAQVSAGELSTADFFGSREYLNNNYLYRFTAAKQGIYGNTKQEALYPMYYVDADDRKLDASTGNYTITLTSLPPVHAFWSITMYDAETQLLVDNPINRYLVNSPMLDSFVRGADGSITFYVQNESPGSALEPNWLPAPSGGFYMAMRLYYPDQTALDGEWTPPPAVLVS
ncbi:putative exported protein [Enhygromyxa salina]|uniref:Putative exported protein n=1 Tax=Enhygromyxa salina TaxID=215803 RepID=A0A0C1ZZ69_9BACT|nr:DUF1254 domain-containing protein [Enhygromyxa salina]KIG16523.1 putative exported protein [Enhygromyxa salina]